MEIFSNLLHKVLFCSKKNLFSAFDKNIFSERVTSCDSAAERSRANWFTFLLYLDLPTWNSGKRERTSRYDNSRTSHWNASRRGNSSSGWKNFFDAHSRCITTRKKLFRLNALFVRILHLWWDSCWNASWKRKSSREEFLMFSKAELASFDVIISHSCAWCNYIV